MFEADLFDALGQTTPPTSVIVRTLRETGQDFEWYPTTQRFLDCIREDIQTVFGGMYQPNGATPVSVLDCGAGDGRALKALSCGGAMYAIEKSEVLINLQPNNCIPVGTDFHQTNLVDKQCQVCFSNPPYREFEQWADVIIRTANARIIYLILPVRWNESGKIQRAIDLRKAKVTVILTDDFLSADRKARARIDILKIDLAPGHFGARWYNRGDESKVDPFTLWFNETFPKKECAASNSDKIQSAQLHQHVHAEMVAGGSLIEALTVLYHRELEHLQKNYAAAAQLDPDLMKELDIKYDGLIDSLKARLKGIKAKYWNEFFSNYDRITDRLSSDSREKMLRVLNENTHVDFNESNALAITLWVLKNANSYFDSQLVELVGKMVSKANVRLYKSNQRTFRDEDWRYTRWRESKSKLECYALEYRIVLEHMGGISTSSYDFQRDEHSGLDAYAASFLKDVLAVASTLGWETATGPKAVTHGRYWYSNTLNKFLTKDGRPLMEVRAFKNGNLHIKFNSALIMQLNVEMGRLCGWLNSKEEAAAELDISLEEVGQYWKSTLNLLPSTASKFLLGLNPGV